ncbi:helix-turn-helix domain-containing protein [Aureliella helgolandensis]|nr:helix-turn-helix transcriptional regulator [Aureliella helgolandensis]
MATVTNETEINDIRDEINEFLRSNGESITALAERSGVPRDFLYRFLNDKYKYAPSFEYISRLVRAIGRRLTTTAE